MRPKGDVDSKRSKPQPIAAPTTTPAINSEESRKPRAIAEALAAPVSASLSGLVSPDFAAAANFGQPLIETSEPCGKRSFVGRFIAISVSALVRAFRHAVETRHDAVEKEIAPRRP